LVTRPFFDGGGRGRGCNALRRLGSRAFQRAASREEPALGDGGNVRAKMPPCFLGFATPPDDAALHRAFAGQFTNACHIQSRQFKERRR